MKQHPSNRFHGRVYSFSSVFWHLSCVCHHSIHDCFKMSLTDIKILT